MSVYFIQAAESRRIKIGVAQDVFRRLQALSIASPEDLILIGVVDGDATIEAALHRRFAKFRVRGEWFHCEGRLAAFVRKLPPPRRQAAPDERPAYPMPDEPAWAWLYGPDMHGWSKRTAYEQLGKTDIRPGRRVKED